MRQVENEAFIKDLQEAADSKQQLADQLSDARAEAASWQHQLAEAKEVQESLKERIRLERTEKQALEDELEVLLFILPFFNVSPYVLCMACPRSLCCFVYLYACCRRDLHCWPSN